MMLSTLTQAQTEIQGELTAFFKKAVSVPPDVQEFEVSMRDLREPNRIKAKKNPDGGVASKQQLFAGACAGTNFFLVYKNGSSEMISGRAGAQSYTLLPSFVEFGSDGFDPQNARAGDRVSLNTDTSFQLISQFLHMGLANVDFDGIVWAENTFLTKTRTGAPVHGELEVTDGVPARLTLSERPGASAYKAIVYEYPKPPQALGGFPRKITILVKQGATFGPFLEILAAQVRLADSRLTPEFFQPERLMSGNVRVTNIWRKGALTTISPRKTLTVPVNSLTGESPGQLVRVRRLLRLCIVCVIAAPLAFLLFRRAIRHDQTSIEQHKQE